MNSILHITDLHFGKSEVELFKNKNVLAERIAETLSPRLKSIRKTFLVISGDIVFKGQVSAYEEAKHFIRNLCNLLKIDNNNVIICPGNHDITLKAKKPFYGLNKLIFDISGNTNNVFESKNNFVLEYDEVVFFILNSVYHLDHTYGLVNLEEIPNLEIKNKLKIAVLHHNLLNIFKKDTSTLRNSYPLIVRLLHDNFSLVLHGHQHFSEAIPIGNNNCHILGAGSLNFLEKEAYPNQFNLIFFKDKKYEIFQYIYQSDIVTEGIIGGWKEHSL